MNKLTTRHLLSTA